MESQNHLQMFYDAFYHVGSGYVWLVYISYKTFAWFSIAHNSCIFIMFAVMLSKISMWAIKYTGFSSITVNIIK